MALDERQDRYPFPEIEARWQKAWADRKQFKVTEEPGRPKYYCLEMFPYPSGRIHMGHVRVYAIGDLLARYKWMRGFNVLHPMGWDAFGLPAENAAIDNGVHPAVWTYENIDNMRTQLKRMGISYDWDREVATCDPAYYKWEQLVFIRMLERGLAYRRRSRVNWCPSCQTVLANEQVEAGRCWRCDSEVTIREIDGWFFKITDYAAGAARLVRPAARLARARAHHAAQLDRPQRGRGVRAAGGGPAGSHDPDLHHAPRHLLRHDLRGAGARSTRWWIASRRTRRSAAGSTPSAPRSRARPRSSGSPPTGRSAACASRPAR